MAEMNPQNPIRGLESSTRELSRETPHCRMPTVMKSMHMKTKA